MTDAAILDALKTLGIAFPVVALLVWMLRQGVDERRTMTVEQQDSTTKVLVTLASTIRANAESQTLLATRLSELAAAESEEIRMHRIDHDKAAGILTEILRVLQANGKAQP